ncbi:MAG: ABC transporter permease [Chitinophagales bacterium]|nr:ABC transporter permease [Chitinophagaceae bacterium]MCB0699749.1 ABC transporter permease [Chitinophagaceae bacterium]MCB9064680.1 ABC transporter permease [Chitinophagales bacterium]
MKQYLKLAWRNIWRNKKRTLITLASIFLAVLLAISMRSMQKGTYANMIGNAVRFSTGYIQVHAKGYWDKPSINNSFESDDILDSLLVNNHNISLAVPRLENFVLASSGDHTKGVQIVGIDPNKENELNNISGKITIGEYFTADDNGILIGDGIADYLELSVGDTIILLGQGYQGMTAAGKFPISGIFHFPDDRMNNLLAYLTLNTAQELFAAYGRYTSMSIMLNHPNKLNQTRHNLQLALNNEDWEVMKWQTMNKTLTQEIAGDNAGGIIMLFILYVVIAFGVFGTILMMTMERRKEFAVMVAIGMKRFQLVLLLVFETIFIGLLGVLSGIILALPVLIYFNVNPVRITGAAAQTFEQFGIEPIMPASLDPNIFLYQGIIVLLISFVASLYPMIYIGRFKILDSLKQ